MKGDDEMKVFRSLIVPGIMLAFLLQVGCVNQEQQLWNKNLYVVSEAAQKLASRGSNRLTTTQLVALLGEPDYRLALGDFLRRAVPTIPKYPNNYRDFVRSALQNAIDKQSRLTEQERADLFKRAEYWVYDETKHFATQSYPGIGYYAWVFVVQDGKIEASTCVFPWHPVSKMGSRRR